MTPRDGVACQNVSALFASPIDKQPGQVLLKWIDPTDYDFLAVEIFLKGNAVKFICEVARGLQQCVISGLTKGTSYSFIVLTKDTSGNKSNPLYTNSVSPY